jgi:hypothetical protein
VNSIEFANERFQVFQRGRSKSALLDVSLAVLHNGCAFDRTCSTCAARMDALKNSTPTLRIGPALKAALKAAGAGHRASAKKKGTRWTAERFWEPLPLRR